ncbi:MAG: hypothetical protein AAGK71_11785 [Pseudomonadota bacterium]
MPLFFAASLGSEDGQKRAGSAVLDALTVDGRRTLQTYQTDKVILALDGDPNHDASCLAKSPNGNVIAFAGYAYNLAEAGLEQGTPDQTARILLAAFEQKGVAAFKGLNGYFAAAIWEAETRKLHVLRDAMGLHPAFVLGRRGATLACSEYQPLMRFFEEENALCPDAVLEYLLAGTVLGGKTFVSDIKMLDAGAALSVQNGRVATQVYDRFGLDEPVVDASLDEHAEAVNEAFVSGMKRRLAHFGPSAGPINLTGGLDTRLILSSIPSDVRADLTWVTSRNPHLAEAEDTEVIYAKLVAARFGVKHIIRAPNPDLSVNDFSDTTFEATRRLPSAAVRNIHGVYGTELLGGCFRAGFEGVFAVTGSVEETVENLFTPEFVAKLGSLDDLKAFISRSRDLGMPDMLRPLLGGFLTTLYGGMLGGWAAPWEKFLLSEHYPFLDREVVNALLRVPPRHLENYALYARLFLNHHRVAAELPFHSGACRHPDLMIVMPGHADPDARARRYGVFADQLRQTILAGQRPHLGSILANWPDAEFLRTDRAQPLTKAQVHLLELEAWLGRYLGFDAAATRPPARG